MLSARFETLFSGLLRAFVRHDDASRSSDQVVELAAARWHLHLARMAIARERQRMAASKGFPAPLRKTALSDDEQARLRVSGMGLVS